MEKQITVKKAYNNLQALFDFAKNESSHKCSLDYDIWEMRTDANGQMEKCLVIKKSGMHAIKVFFIQENIIKINYIIPNKIMNAYFGKSEKAYRSILEIIGGGIKNALLAGSQKKAFEEIESVFERITI